MHSCNGYLKPILKALFQAEQRRLANTIDKLSELNQEALRMRLDGFMFMGQFYRHSRAAAGGGQRRTLHISLWPQMDAHLAERKKIDDDMASINQMLFRLLDPCFCDQDIRDAIPDCIIDILPPRISSLKRARNLDFFSQASP